MIMCDACLILSHRLDRAEKRLAHCEELLIGFEQVKVVCARLGVSVDVLFDNLPGHEPNRVRDAVIVELVGTGWTAAKCGSVLRMSERSIRRVLGRNRGTTQVKPLAAVAAGAKVAPDE